MKRIWVLSMVVASFVFLNGCKEEGITVPESEDPMLLVSHAKEATLSFVDSKTDEDLGSTTIPFTFTDMTYISDKTIVGMNPSEDRILEIDLDQQVTRPFLEVGSGITGLTYDSYTDTLFLKDTFDHAVRVVDGSSKEEGATIQLDSSPSELEVNKEGLLFVLTSDRNEVSVVDIMKEEVIRTFPVNDTPAGMYFDGALLWVGGHGSNGQLNQSVYAYDPQTGENVMTVDVGLMPIAMISSENSEKLFVLCHGDHSLYKVNTETQEVESKVDVGQNPNDLQLSEDKLFVANLDSDSISIVSKLDLSLIKTVPVASGPYLLLSEVEL
ncbi:YncE family protein [Alkalicoccobacillus murimartini]|uniref:DNA-binding beta-propeller fold protein YncE n=1 Tax=Alkalicoccobacillus murimartini TaxID=171685 RepID=A0ABT9YDG4_9BACI|nr:YncE family protein [Alkalicoccobacillus murimartini]MDQ0205663.1 DNA-binding beta-propeller fold protein YncE [Alkalicoccobacillus murimartini]